MQPDHIETATRATVATAASYTSSGGLLIFGVAANEFAALAGLALAFGTFCINWYYRHKEHNRGNRKDLR